MFHDRLFDAAEEVHTFVCYYCLIFYFGYIYTYHVIFKIIIVFVCFIFNQHKVVHHDKVSDSDVSSLEAHSFPGNQITFMYEFKGWKEKPVMESSNQLGIAPHCIVIRQV